MKDDCEAKNNKQQKVSVTQLPQLKAKRMLRRVRADKVLTRIGEKEGKRSKECTKWTYEGHSGEDAAVKARMREARETEGLSCRYVRGLRVPVQNNG